MDRCLIRPFSQTPSRLPCREFRRRAFLLPQRANSTVSNSAKENLSWPEYLAVRRGKRKWELAATFPCAVLGFAGGALYFGTLETDATKPVFGFDPLMFYGFCTVGCVGAGALVGPIIGGTLWRLTHRRTMALIEARDRQFYQRIQKKRVDPNSQSATNPVPDYYGEKIGSLHQYRQWLRDQAKYKRKSDLPEE